MKQLIIPLALTVTLALPAHAQDDGDMDQGFDLMEEGARLLLRGLLSEMDPALEELKDLAEEVGPQMRLFAEEMGPALAALLEKVDDLTHYEAPELLPNGDIIIRRRPDAPLYVPDVAEDGGQIDL